MTDETDERLARDQAERDAKPREDMEVWVVNKIGGVFSIVARSNLHGHVRRAFEPLHGSPSHRGWLAATGHAELVDKYAGAESLVVLAPNPVEKP